MQGQSSTSYSRNLPHSISMSYGDLNAGLTENAYHLPSDDLYPDLGPEEHVIGNHNEKKLTTTPIPSDAEKMSSSGSSTSSRSPGESPSPQTDLDQVGIDTRQTASKSVFSTPPNQLYPSYSNDAAHSLSHGDRELVNQVSASGSNISGELYTNENSQTLIPVPENVIEIDDGSIDFSIAERASVKDSISISLGKSTSNSQLYSSSNNNGTNPQVTPNSKTNVGDRNSLNAESHPSWSVMREERRKHKLEKTMQRAKQHDVSASLQRDAPMSLQPTSIEKLKKNDAQSRKLSHHKHKHKRTKHFHHIPPNVIAMPVPHRSSNTYSGLIPKVTADPTNNINYKSAGPPRSITEKVLKQQMMKEKTKTSTAYTSKNVVESKSLPSDTLFTVNSSKPSAPQQPITAEAAIQPSVTYSHIAPSKFATAAKNVASNNTTTCRWQTVTAIQGPKMPPMLSERDRIPKRGRPSKKMTEMNLKYKVKTNPSEAKVTPAPAVDDKPNIVSMYTINESGGIEKLENKPKQNQRSKERAEAFRNELLEISKKATIQMKTAGAKEAVGAFKAVGVRTRKQANSNTETDDGKKKAKTKSRVFGGENPVTGKGTDKVMDENCIYTFSELAKQFKISNSILYRAIEQSHRSSMSRRNSKASQKLKEKIRETSSSKPLPSPIPEKAEEILPSKVAHDKEKNKLFDVVANVQRTPVASLSSEKNTDLAVEVAKRKKKKKKHKKEKNELGRKKKNKDKKKKSKRKEKEGSSPLYALDSNNKVFSSCAAADATAPPQLLTEEPKKENYETKQETSDVLIDITKSLSKNSGVVTSTEKPAQQLASVSSLSGGEDVYGGSDSFSDTEISLTVSESKINRSSFASTSVTTAAPTVATSSAAIVFGSGISSLMPTFQGIKEHGGLQQFSEHSKNLAETNLFRGKKKHKKKKPIRAKNVSDPEFLSKMESLVESLMKMKLSSSVSMPSLFGNKTFNIFAKVFSSFNSSSCWKINALSYREPHSSRVEAQHHDNTSHNERAGQGCLNTSLVSSDMSIFCRSSFFTKNGMIKPCEESTDTNLLKSPITHKQSSSGKIVECAKPSQKPVKFTEIADHFPDSEPSITPSVNTPPAGASKDEVLYSSKKANCGNLMKSGKRKRGWPRGKPRGPRAKLPLTANGQVSMISEANLDKAQNNHEILERHVISSSNLSIGQASKGIKVVDRDPPTQSQSVDDNSEKIKVSGQSDFQASTGGFSAPINQDLVNHIKAVITASLSSAAVCSDTVAQTVDNAVASYMQNIETPVLQTPSIVSKPIKIADKSRPKGRPQKCGAPDKVLKEADSNKASDKHPKKLWAFKHQEVSAGLGVAAQKSEKRRPGRPRKYPSVDGEPPVKISKKTKLSILDKPIASNRMSATKQTAQKTPKSIEQKHPKVSTKVKSVSVMTTSSVLKPLKTQNFQKQQIAKIVSNSSTKTSSKPACSKLGGRASKRKLSLLVPTEDPNQTADPVSKSQQSLKKSLESVVAKLKRKQSTSAASSSELSPSERRLLVFQVSFCV